MGFVRKNIQRAVARRVAEGRDMLRDVQDRDFCGEIKGLQLFGSRTGGCGALEFEKLKNLISK